MGFSPLANMSRRIPHGNRQTPRNSAISGFTIHHQAGVNAQGEASNPNRDASANYWITNEGDILPNIDENYRAWTSGHRDFPEGAKADHRNITVEVSNSPAGVQNGTWAISAAAMNALIRLIGDVFKRHNLGVVKRATYGGVAVHQDFVPTECPGPYIMANLGNIINQAENYRKSGSSPSVPDTKPVPPTPYPGNPQAFLNRIIRIDSWYNYKTAAEAESVRNAVRAMPAGDYKVTKISGKTPHLVKTDGKHSGWVHSSVLSHAKIVDGGSSVTPPPAAKPSVTQVAQDIIAGRGGWGNDPQRSQKLNAAGYNSVEVQREVNRLLNVGSTPAKSVTQVAREIVYGVNGKNPWGNDPQRSANLRAAGYDPAAVQREVNKLV